MKYTRNVEKLLRDRNDSGQVGAPGPEKGGGGGAAGEGQKLRKFRLHNDLIASPRSSGGIDHLEGARSGERKKEEGVWVTEGEGGEVEIKNQ